MHGYVSLKYSCEAPTSKVTIKIKLSNWFSTFVYSGHRCRMLMCLCWQRAIQTLISRVDVSLLHSLEHLLGAVAPFHCARQPIGSSPDHAFCTLHAGAGVSGCGSNGGCNHSYAGKCPEHHLFQSPAASLCVVLYVFHYTKTSPRWAHLHKITHETKALEKMPFQNHLCVLIQAAIFTLSTHTNSTHIPIQPQKEGNTSEHPFKAPGHQMKWRNEKMHHHSDLNVFQPADSVGLYILYVYEKPKPEKCTRVHQQVN